MRLRKQLGVRAQQVWLTQQGTPVEHKAGFQHSALVALTAVTSVTV